MIIGVSVHPLAALSAYFLSRLESARFLFEVADLLPETVIEYGAAAVYAGFVDAGVSVYAKTLLGHIPVDGNVSLERAVVPSLAEAGLLASFRSPRPFLDIGSPEQLHLAQELIP